MATPVQTRTQPFLTAEALVEALKGAAVTAGIALVLFVPLVGISTEASQQLTLALKFNWTLAISLVLAVTVGRFLVDIFIWRQEAPFERLLHTLGAGNVKAVLLGALAVCYVAGGVFLIVPASREVVSGGLSAIPASWLSLTMVVIIGAFALVTAMAITRVARLLIARSIIDRASLTANPGQEFAPGLLLVAVLLPVLAAGPQQRYALDTGMQIVTYLMLGWGLNIVVGLAGLLDLGYVAFYAVGAYSYALLSTHYGMSFWICLPLAGILAAFWGMLLGFPVLRLRGDYLAIVTLAFGEIIYLVLKNWYSFTQGPDGINRIPKLTFFGLPFSASADVSFSSVFGLEYNPVHSMIFFYYVILVLALFTNFVTSRLRRLPIGRAWEALREDEIACKSLGINTVTTKLTAFATGAMFAGLAGTFYATRQGIVSPEVFTFKVSADVLIIVVLSGLGSQTGIIIATMLVIGTSEFLRELAQYRMLIFGAGMVALMTWRPQGLVGTRTPSVMLNAAKPIDGGLTGKGTG